MKKVIETTHQIDASLEAVWTNVRTGADWERWMPLIASSEMQGEGAGAKRVCHTADQGDLYETILKADDDTKEFQYRIDEQTMLPAENVVGVMKLSVSGKGTRLDWSVSFDMDAAHEGAFPEIKKMIEDVYAASARQLEQLAMA